MILSVEIRPKSTDDDSASVVTPTPEATPTKDGQGAVLQNSIAFAPLLRQRIVVQKLRAPARQQDDPLPPAIVSVTPADGESWDGEPVVFVFDATLDPLSADGLTVDPALAGEVTVDGARLIFTPSETPEAGTRYHFSLDEQVRTEEGAALNGLFEISLVGAWPLLVTNTQPGDGVEDIAPDTPVVVVFNKPVVPLTGLDEQADLPDPLTIEPGIDGEGRWLNTSVYTFEPTDGWAGATTYSVSVAPLVAQDGSKAENPSTFSFTTAQPLVVEAMPSMDSVRPDAVISVVFSQKMDQASTEAAFQLRPLADGQPAGPAVDGVFDWGELGERFVFTPTQSLDFSQRYQIHVSTAALAAGRQGTLRSEFNQEFSTVGLPRVISTRPQDGATRASPENGVLIRFSGVISAATVLENISISPPLTSTTVYSYFSPWSNELSLSWLMRPDTTYSITLGEEIADEFGNTLGDPYTLSFTTGDYAPLVQLSLPQFTHFSAYTQTTAGILHRNMNVLDVALYRLPVSEFLGLAGPDSWQVWQRYSVPDPEQNLIWQLEYDAGGVRNETFRQPVALVDENDEPLAPGIYLLQVALPSSEDEYADTHARSVIVVTNDNLVLKKSFQGESLAWQTDLLTGEPVPGQTVQFFQSFDDKGDAVTDEDGVAAAALALNEEQPWVGLVAISGRPGDEHFAVASTDWQDGISPWQFDVQTSYSIERLRTVLYTDRPIYRPGQTVYWKGIVRTIEDDDTYGLPSAGLPVHVTIRDEMGNTILQRTFAVNENGTINGEVALADMAGTGYYYLESRIELDKERSLYGGTGFQVAEYRAPEFEISVESAEDEYTQGDTITVAVQASYFSGGPLGDAPVEWRLLADPYTFSWADQPHGRRFGFEPAALDDESINPYAAGQLGLMQEGSGRTNADGIFTLQLPADLGDALLSQRWSIDVTVQSPNNQFVSGRTSFPVHHSNLYIGLSPVEYLGRAGDPMTIDFVTLTPQQDRFGDTDLDVVIYDYRWNSVYEQGADGVFRWETSVEKTPVYTTSVSSDADGMGQFTWTPDSGGNFYVTARGEDADGNSSSSGIFVWVQAADGDAFIPWARENNDRLELVADRDLYAPGDVAQVLVPSPFTGPVYALVTIERGGVLQRSVQVLESNSETLSIPIRADYIPNVYLSVVLVKGVDETNPFPAMRVGYVQLPVDSAAKELTLDISTSVPQARPGDTITYTISVADNNGDAVSGAELSLALIDKAVLSLAEGTDRPLIDQFYTLQPLGVNMGATLVINQDRLSQQLSEGGKGGGGGGPGGGLTLRQIFADVAYWRADAISDADGMVSFEVTLPDNLTTWQLVARAVTDETQVGDATADLIASKEVLIRPMLPRFFTSGDRARIGAVLQNNSDVDLPDAELTISVEGGRLQSSHQSAAGQQINQSVNIAAGAMAEETWLLIVDDTATQVVITYTLQPPADVDQRALGDAVRLVLPVQRYETPETVGTAGIVPAEGRLEAILVPEAATDTGTLSVQVEPSLAAGLISGLTYLEHYPYECVEQTVSRFLPNLFSVLAVQELGIDRPNLQADLDAQIEIGLQRLLNQQNPDGGWGWWPGMQSNRFITSYVLWGLWHAQEAGYPVSPNSIANTLSFLDGGWQAPDAVTNDWELNEMAFTHFVLSEMGEGDPGRVVTLYAVNERLDIYGQAFLAMALANLAGEDGAQSPRVTSLLDNIRGQAILSATGAHWQEEGVDWWTMNSDTRTTAIVLTALTRLRPDDALLPNVVRWLMLARQDGRWASTQETAWSIVGLSEWMAATAELEANYDWQVTLNGATLGEGSVSPETVDQPVNLRVAVSELLRGEANALAFRRNNDSGNLYYTAQLRYFLDATAIPAQDRGLVVSRRMTAADGDHAGETVSGAAVGDVISVTVTLQAPSDIHYMLLEVPIPAGTEPIDASLATESNLYGSPELGITEPETAAAHTYWWRPWIPSHSDIRDEKVALFADLLPAGTYEYTFLVRASLPGEYRVLPARAEAMYFPDVWGRSSGDLFTVTEN